jgi:hypothetical protein
MQAVRRMMAAALVLACLPWPAAQAGFAVGVNIGIPFYPRPYVGFGYYYRPYPVYVAPAPVIVQPAPVIQAVPVVQPAYAAPAAAPPPPAPAPSAVQAARAVDTEPYFRELTSPDERMRAEAVLQLGRLRSRQAVEPLTLALGGDASPAVREAAARGLGLIGSPVALTALQRAAQADEDRDVRRSASFAAEVIRANLQGRE